MYPDSVNVVVPEGTLFPLAHCLLYSSLHTAERVASLASTSSRQKLNLTSCCEKNIPSFFLYGGEEWWWLKDWFGGRLFCCWESFSFNIAQPNVPVSQQKIKTTENFRGLKLCYRVSCNFLSSNLRQQRVTISGNQHQGKGCPTLKITDKKLNTPFWSPNLQIQRTLHVSSEKTLHIYHLIQAKNVWKCTWL